MEVLKQTGKIFHPDVLEELDYKTYGFTEADLDKEIQLEGDVELGQFYSRKASWTLRELMAELKKLYCGKVAFQFTHISDASERQWVQDKIAAVVNTPSTKEQKLITFHRLLKSDSFTEFQKIKYPNTKRFGIEGSDTFVTGLNAMMDRAVNNGVEHAIIGMAHRGRLNTLAIVLKKPYDQIFAEFHGNPRPQDYLKSWGNSGDVKYHLGMNHIKSYGENKVLNIVRPPRLRPPIP